MLECKRAIYLLFFSHFFVDFKLTEAHHPFREQQLRMAKMSLLNSLKIVTAILPMAHDWPISDVLYSILPVGR
jgi:hypothetical protein